VKRIRSDRDFWRELVVGQLATMTALVLAVAATGFVHGKMPKTTASARGEAFVPEPQVAKVMALGFDSAMADFYWLQAIQAIGGDVHVDDRLGNHLGKLIDVVTTLDPWVDHPYRFAAIWLTESEENVLTANRLLERGIEHHPDEWRNRFYLGFNQFFYLMQNEAAAEQLLAASKLPGAPAYLGRLVARLRAETADIDVAETLLWELIRNTDDELVKEGYMAALDEIEIEKKARFLDRAREAFNRLNGRDIMSVDELVIGPHPMLEKLPNPEPESLPTALRRGSVWRLDLESDDIVSTYYDRRYRVHYASHARAKAERWAVERERPPRGGDRNRAHEGTDEPREGSSDVR